MLYSMRAQLPGLQRLALTLNTGRVWPMSNVFSELVDMTQLTRLCLHFKGTKVSTYKLRYPS
jgi:hypothetical protein